MIFLSSFQSLCPEFFNLVVLGQASILEVSDLSSEETPSLIIAPPEIEPGAPIEVALVSASLLIAFFIVDESNNRLILGTDALDTVPLVVRQFLITHCVSSIRPDSVCQASIYKNEMSVMAAPTERIINGDQA